MSLEEVDSYDDADANAAWSANDAASWPAKDDAVANAAWSVNDAANANANETATKSARR